MVEVGRSIAGRAPHRIGSAPVEAGGTGKILGQCQYGKRPAQCFQIDGDDVEPRLHEGSDARAYLHRGERFGWQSSQHGLVNMREPGIDHIDRAARKSETRDGRVDARRGGGHVECRRGPTVERGVHRQVGREYRAHFVERRIGSRQRG